MWVRRCGERKNNVLICWLANVLIEMHKSNGVIKNIELNRMKKTIALVVAVMAFVSVSFSQQNHTLVVKAAQPTATIQPTMWGIFFEDINLGADGGIYAEMVKNRSFEFLKPLMGWTVNRKKFVEGEVLVINR